MSPAQPSAPVFYVLAQVSFNPIVKIADFVPAVQDVLRREGWPEYSHQTTKELQVSPGAGGPPEVSSSDRHRWAFNAVDEKQGFVLTENSLVFHSTAYPGFEPFLQAMLRGLAVVHGAVELQYVGRIGLRYVNAIDPETVGGVSLEALLLAGLLGLSGPYGHGLKHSFSETVSEHAGGTLISRNLITPEGVVWPPDLQPPLLALDERFQPGRRRVAILDNDFFLQFHKPHLAFSDSAIEEQLRRCHDMTSQTFYTATTERARSLWALT